MIALNKQQAENLVKSSGDPEPCDHQWHYIEDWEGDPTLHNGTNDLSHWECEKCGATKHKSFNPYGEDWYD